jgi:hypothetical protein
VYRNEIEVDILIIKKVAYYIFSSNYRSLQGNINRGSRSGNVHTPTRPPYREASGLYSSKNPHNQGS